MLKKYKKHTQYSKSTRYSEIKYGVHIVLYVLNVPIVPFRPALGYRAVFY